MNIQTLGGIDQAPNPWTQVTLQTLGTHEKNKKFFRFIQQGTYMHASQSRSLTGSLTEAFYAMTSLGFLL